jgi:hypothetical protein
MGAWPADRPPAKVPPGLRTDTAKVLISPDGRNAYAAGDQTLTGFTLSG